MTDKIPHDVSVKVIGIFKLITQIRKMRKDVEELKFLIGHAQWNTEEEKAILNKWFLIFGKEEFGVSERLLEVENDMCTLWTLQNQFPF